MSQNALTTLSAIILFLIAADLNRHTIGNLFLMTLLMFFALGVGVTIGKRSNRS